MQKSIQYVLEFVKSESDEVLGLVSSPHPFMSISKGDLISTENWTDAETKTVKVEALLHYISEGEERVSHTVRIDVSEVSDRNVYDERGMLTI